MTDKKTKNPPVYTGPESINNPDELIRKRCSSCKEYKPFDDFYNNRTSGDGKDSRCIECVKQYWKEYSVRVAARRAEYRKARSADPIVRENIRKYAKKYAASPEHAERIRELARKNYRKRKDAQKAESLAHATKSPNDEVDDSAGVRSALPDTTAKMPRLGGPR